MKRCDALQASLRDAGQELSGVEDQLSRAVSAGANDVSIIRQLEEQLDMDHQRLDTVMYSNLNQQTVCRSLQSNLQETLQDLNDVEQQLAHSVASGAQDYILLRQLEEELETHHVARVSMEGRFRDECVAL